MDLRKVLLGICSNIGIFILIFVVIDMSGIKDGSSLYKALISAASANSIYFLINLFWIIVNVFGRIFWISGTFSERLKEKQFNKFVESKGEILKDSNSIITLFKYTPTDIMIGEKVIGRNGKQLKNISKIKDTILRLCVEQEKDVTFAICTYDGTTYKMINFLDKKYLFPISYNELNRCIEMKSEIHDKYKKITKDNWKFVCKNVSRI